VTVRIEPMCLEDLEEVVKIEEISFPTPWSRRSFLYELLENERAVYIVAREEKTYTHGQGSRAGLSRVSESNVNYSYINQARVDFSTGKNRRQAQLGEARVQGYVGMWIVLNEGHITTLAVHPRARGHGIGELLLKALMDRGRNLGVTCMTLEVRLSNLTAQNLYIKLGFRSSGIRPRYYLDNNEDALIMWKSL